MADRSVAEVAEVSLAMVIEGKIFPTVNCHLVFKKFLSVVSDLPVLKCTLCGLTFMASSTSCPVAASVLHGSSDIQSWFKSPALQ